MMSCDKYKTGCQYLSSSHQRTSYKKRKNLIFTLIWLIHVTHNIVIYIGTILCVTLTQKWKANRCQVTDWLTESVSFFTVRNSSEKLFIDLTFFVSFFTSCLLCTYFYQLKDSQFTMFKAFEFCCEMYLFYLQLRVSI